MNVLHLDDDFAILHVVKEILKKKFKDDIKVISVTNYNDAQFLFDHYSYDLVICDYLLNEEKNGFDFYFANKKNLEKMIKIKFIFLSSHVDTFKDKLNDTVIIIDKSSNYIINLITTIQEIQSVQRSS